MTGIGSILAPRSVAVVGASRRSDSMGHQILQNLIAYGFSGAVYPVNPRAASICSVRAYPAVADVPDPIDLAVIVVPKEQVVEMAASCGDAGVKGLIVITAGFREADEEGAARERDLAAVNARYGMRMVGPNCMGVINADPSVSMNATFVTAMPPFGQCAFVSQSGALGMSVLDYASEFRIGISQFVSVGNKADVSGNDLLLHWEHDAATRVILMYAENFGNPQRFLEVASRLTKVKPIIVVKSGRSRAGARAATSHTGALAASDTAVEALLEQAGVLRASTVEELFDMAMAFGVAAKPRSRRTAVLTNAGGPGILAADAMEAHGLDLVELAAPTVERLRSLFPTYASIRNPLDMIASATPAGYEAALTALLADPGVDTVVPIFVPPFGVRQEDVANAIVSAARTAPAKPVLAVLMGRDGLPAGREELHKANIPAYIFPESAARAVAALNRHVEWAARASPSPAPLTGIDSGAVRAILTEAAREGREQLNQVEALDVLRDYGVAVVRTRLVAKPGELARAVREVGFPLALKIVSPDVVHKTEIGAVRVGITGEQDASRSYDEVLAAVRLHAPRARVDGALVQQMVEGITETIVGVTRDPVYGPLVMFGLGGVFVEALRDVVFRIAPVDDAQAREMVDGIRGRMLLEGFRGGPSADRAALASVVRRIGQLAADFPEITELDVNPLMALETGAIAVDARISIRPGGQGRGAGVQR